MVWCGADLRAYGAYILCKSHYHFDTFTFSHTKLPKVARSCQKIPKKLPKAAKIRQMLPKCAKSCPSGQKWTQGDHLSTWVHLCPLGSTGLHLAPLVSTWLQLGSVGSNWVHWAPLGSTGPHWAPLAMTRAPLGEQC